jgi:hypothetical protein
MHKFKFRTVLELLIPAVIGIIIYKQEFSPMYRDLSGVMMVSKPDHTDVLVNGIRDHYCIPKSIDALIEVDGKMVPATAVEFLGRHGEILSPTDQLIGLGAVFVRLGRITPGSNHIQLFVNAQCLPFITRRYMFLDVTNKIKNIE